MNRAVHTGGTPFFNSNLFLIARFKGILQSGIQENLNGAVPRMGGLRGKYGRF
jgi:hypothetical protein